MTCHCGHLEISNIVSLDIPMFQLIHVIPEEDIESKQLQTKPDLSNRINVTTYMHNQVLTEKTDLSFSALPPRLQTIFASQCSAFAPCSKTTACGTEGGESFRSTTNSYKRGEPAAKEPSHANSPGHMIRSSQIRCKVDTHPLRHAPFICRLLNSIAENPHVFGY